jgi:hypothetical protein
MSRAKPLFRENDVRRLVRAASKAGLEVDRVVVERSGNIYVVVAGGDDADAPAFDQQPAVPIEAAP